MNKQELIDFLQKNVKCQNPNSIGSEAFNNAIDITILHIKDLDEQKECKIEQFEYDLEQGEWTTQDDKYRCSHCKNQIYLTDNLNYCQYCGYKIKGINNGSI